MLDSASSPFDSLLVFEQDAVIDTTHTWAFPHCDSKVERVLKQQITDVTQSTDDESLYLYSKHSHIWHYILSFTVPPSSPLSQRTQRASLVIRSKTYNPDKYQSLLAMFYQQYLESNGTPTSLLAHYLALATTNQCLSFNDRDYDDRRAMIASVKKLIDVFQLEVILIWIAVLMKKRIFVYHPNISELLQLVRAVPIIGAWHRQQFDTLLKPYCTLIDDDFAELDSGNQSYIVGFISDASIHRKQHYDLYVNAADSNLTINESSIGNKQDFALSKIHKSTAENLVKAGELSEIDAIKAIQATTAEITDKVSSLRPQRDDGSAGLLTAELLSEHRMPPNLERFIWNVAAAEGWAKK